jgi:hypothetical protein
MQGACGARYYGTYRADRGGGIRQYRCHGNHVYADSRCADRWRPHANALETAVWEEIGRVLTHENLVRLADAWLAREQLRQQPLIEQLQEEVLRLEVVVASTAVDLVKAGMDPAAAARAVGHLNEDLLSKRRRLDGAQGTRTDAPGDDLRAEALALQAADRLETLSYEDQRRLVALLGVELRVEQKGGRARPGLVRLRGGLPAMLLRSWVHPRHDASAFELTQRENDGGDRTPCPQLSRAL